MKEKQSHLIDRMSYFWLVLGAVLLMLSAGNFSLGFAAWLAPIFLIRFARTQRVGRGFLLLYIGCYLASVLSWRNILSAFFPLPVFLIFGTFIGLQYALPYLADRLLARRIKGFAVTLIYPSAITALMFIYNLVSPMGSWGTIGYEQYYNLPLIQIVSLTGLWGLTFLISWLGSVVNWAWEQSLEWTKTRAGLAVWAFVMISVMLYGGLRLSFSKDQVNTVQVHGLNVNTDWANQPDIHTDLDGYRAFSMERNNDLFQETIRQADRGAQLVLWTEMAAQGMIEDIDQVIEQGKEIAQQEGIYLAMGIEAHYPGESQSWDNKVIIINQSGEVILEHDKYGAIFIYGLLGDPAKQGEFTIKTSETAIGTLSAIVCWDADFPHIVRQAGKQKVDILLLSNGDGPGHFREHAQMAIFRAIENGFSLVRQDARGLSLAADPYGRILAMVDVGAADEPIMSAKVSTEGVFALYPIIGDLFGWLSVVGFVTLVVIGVLKQRRKS
jgi:apolipoprotein N-acyltransferase